ncbi:hypothetical protein [Hyphococcus lacteus]|uniref:DUF4417 domain-containing protein n=1 Tax=Hyphococcus lacteus TaxID=3143536 RepID=A0ABV3ZB15_9PROT
MEANIEDCLWLCCGKPETCNRVCKNHRHKFVDQVREIGGFRLRDVPRAPALSRPTLPPVVPLVYHGSSRKTPLANPVVALRMADLVNFVTRKPRFEIREALIESFGLSSDARIILSGIDKDERIEPFWSLGDEMENIVRSFKEIGVEHVTTPNFSVVLDHPRYEDLHSIKKIGLMFAAFQSAGMPCALHPNGRTEKDAERWSRFVAERFEVEALAYEFITGPSRKDRKSFHVDHLTMIAENCPRPLDIILRGDPDVIPALRKVFRTVTYIDTTGFMRSIKRQRAVRVGNDHLEWTPTPTAKGAPIDELVEYNLRERELLLKSLYFADLKPLRKAA